MKLVLTTKLSRYKDSRNETRNAITYLFPLDFFSRTFAIIQVGGTRFMAVPEIMPSSFFLEKHCKVFLELSYTSHNLDHCLV